MDPQFNKPKGFGEILDHTFRLSKKRFKDFFLIFLILVGPVYLLDALLQLLGGTNFFREIDGGGSWFEQILTSFNGTSTEFTTTDSSTSILTILGAGITGILSMILLPIAEAAILFALNHIRKNEEYTVKMVIKQAFSRFWPIIGSAILFGLITVGIIIIPIMIVSFGGVFGASMDPIRGVIFVIITILAFGVGIGYLLTRWSFYFGAVVLENEAPGLSRAWSLTKNRTWPLMGLYIVFTLIVTIINSSVELSFGAVLGSSVLFSLIVNVVTLFTSMVFAVGFAVMFLDLKIRHDGDDLKEMIEDYDAIQS